MIAMSIFFNNESGRYLVKLFFPVTLGEPGPAAPRIFLDRYKGDPGERGFNGQPGGTGLPGPKGIETYVFCLCCNLYLSSC